MKSVVLLVLFVALSTLQVGWAKIEDKRDEVEGSGGDWTGDNEDYDDLEVESSGDEEEEEEDEKLNKTIKHEDVPRHHSDDDISFGEEEDENNEEDADLIKDEDYKYNLYEYYNENYEEDYEDEEDDDDDDDDDEDDDLYEYDGEDEESKKIHNPSMNGGNGGKMNNNNNNKNHKEENSSFFILDRNLILVVSISALLTFTVVLIGFGCLTNRSKKVGPVIPFSAKDPRKCFQESSPIVKNYQRVPTSTKEFLGAHHQMDSNKKPLL